MEKQLNIREEIEVNASTSKVWDALVNPSQTKKYMFGCEAISDWKVGSSLIWKGVFDGKELVAVTGKIVAIEKERYLAYTTFDPHGNLQDIPGNHTTVIYELTNINGKTKLVVTQGDFAKVGDGEKRYQDTIAGGGWMTILTEIKKILE